MNQENNEPTEEEIILNMTKAINAENIERIEQIEEEEAAAPAKKSRGRPRGSSRSKSPSRRPEPECKPPPPPQPKKEENTEVTELANLRFKIKCFLGSKYMQNVISEEIKDMPEKTIAQCIEKLKCIYQSRTLNYKKTMVGKMFDAMCGLLEEGTKFYMPYMDGFAEDVGTHREMFDNDLEELAIDLSDAWVPGPTMRILSSLMIVMNQRRKMYWTYDTPVSNKLKSAIKKTDDNK